MNREIKETIDYLKAHEDNLAFRINELLKYVDELQKENEYSNYSNEELRKKITNLEYKKERLEEDNKQLKELCDKYEEEHSTTFNLWTMKMKEMPDYEEKMNYKSKIDKVIELKHNWLSIKENETIVFDNSSLIELMNNLEKILKEDK